MKFTNVKHTAVSGKLILPLKVLYVGFDYFTRTAGRMHHRNTCLKLCMSFSVKYGTSTSKHKTVWNIDCDRNVGVWYSWNGQNGHPSPYNSTTQHRPNATRTPVRWQDYGLMQLKPSKWTPSPYDCATVHSITQLEHLCLCIYAPETAVVFSVFCSVKMGMLFKKWECLYL